MSEDQLTMYQRLREFFIETAEVFSDGFEMDWNEFEAIAEKLDLIEWETFDPDNEAHQIYPLMDAELGDPIWLMVEIPENPE